MKGITVLGATGSIGLNTLDVVARHGDRFRVVALTANTRWERLLEQCRRWRPELAVLREPGGAARLEEALRREGLPTRVATGEAGLVEAAAHPEAHYVMAAIVGGAGLQATLAAARAGKRVLLANKEALVMAGALFMDTVRDAGAELLPIDSEHNAIFQCMPEGFRAGERPAGVEQVLLTASGGPFRTLSPEAMARVTPDQACTHPNWDMGRKISVDSATMMNKGLEIIEARWLFGLSLEQVQVVVHPQSVVHSLVQYTDGSVLAQLGQPDMRTPIAHALAWPERMPSGVAPLDLFRVGRLEFEPPDPERFPCLRLAVEAARRGGNATIGLNAANEVAVAEFLAGRIPFPAIPAIIEEVMAQAPAGDPRTLDEILAADARARSEAAARAAIMAEQRNHA